MSEDLNLVESKPSWRIPARRALGVAAIGACVFGGAAVYSVTHASVHDSFGPHEATYSLNTSGEVAANFGPFGSLRHTSDGLLPSAAKILNLGATVDVGEIPQNTPIGNNPENIVNLFSNDAQAYVQFFTHPEITIDTVANKLKTDIAQHTLLYGSEISLGLGAIYLSLGQRRRQELKEYAKTNQRKGIATLGLFSVLTGCVASEAPSYQVDSGAHQASSIFNGTPLEGTYTTGRFGEIVNTYGTNILNYIHENDAYYGKITKNMEKALGNYTVPGGNPDKFTTALLVSDLHCNTGMANPIHVAVEKTGANMYLDSGDTVMSGTSVEGYCIHTFAAAIPKDVQKVVSPGNHDSSLTRKQEEDDGYIVLQGKEETVEGITIIGDSDPYLNVIGQPVLHVTDESLTDLGNRMSDLACSQDKPVNLLMIHRPGEAQKSLEEGCVDLALTGHMHTADGPHISSNGSIGYTSGTTGGASEDLPTIESRLGTDSKMSVWLFDKETNKPAYMRTITTSTDGEVSLSAWTDLQPIAFAGTR